MRPLTGVELPAKHQMGHHYRVDYIFYLLFIHLKMDEWIKILGIWFEVVSSNL